MGDTKGVLVKFPAAILASLDGEAKRRGVARLVVILERCAREGGADAPAILPTAPRGPTTVAAPVRRAASVAPAKAILAKAEERAAHLGARAMDSAGVTFGNVRGPMQKGGKK